MPEIRRGGEKDGVGCIFLMYSHSGPGPNYIKD